MPNIAFWNGIDVTLGSGTPNGTLETLPSMPGGVGGLARPLAHISRMARICCADWNSYDTMPPSTLRKIIHPDR